MSIIQNDENLPLIMTPHCSKDNKQGVVLLRRNSSSPNTAICDINSSSHLHGSPNGKPRRKRKRKSDFHMVSELFDSLTPAAEYFADGNRRRGRLAGRQSSYKETEMAMIATANALISDKQETPFIHNRKRRADDPISFSADISIPLVELNRPPTPEAEVRERERIWQERMEKRREKMQRRRHMGEEIQDTDLAIIDEAYGSFTSNIENIFENFADVDMAAGEEEDDIPSEFLVNRLTLEELCHDAKKLRTYNATEKLSSDMKKISKLLTILEKNIRDTIQAEAAGNFATFFDDQDDDDYEATFRELMEERMLRSSDAALTALTIMSCPGMPKEALIEDTIERCIQLCKQLNSSIVFPAHDATRRLHKVKKVDEGQDEKKKKPKNQLRRVTNLHNKRTNTVRTVTSRMNEIIGCLAELVEKRTLGETSIVQLSSMCIEPFFVEGIGDMQYNALRLTCAIFSRYERLRNNMLGDILGSLHRIPSGKGARQSYRLTAGEAIQMMTALMLHLVHSVVQQPLDVMGLKKQGINSDQEEEFDNSKDPGKAGVDAELLHGYDAAKMIAHTFLDTFLKKCTAKNEDDYRTLFERFLKDLLECVHKPEWPAAELALTLLGNLLLKTFRNKQLDMSLRTSALDYLGMVTARLRRDEVNSKSDSSSLDNILLYIHNHTLPESRIPDNKLCTEHEKQNRILQSALVDYLDVGIQENDEVYDFARAFTISQWYKDAVTEHERIVKEQERLVRDGDGEISHRIALANDAKASSSQVLIRSKHYLRKLVDRHHENMLVILKTQPGAQMTVTGTAILTENQAAFLCKYLASGRAFSKSFDMYLASIQMAVIQDTAVNLRTKAMKCLMQVIDADPSVLSRPRVRETVQARLVDTSGSVREQTVHLLGDYVLKQPQLVDSYYDILSERIKDTSVSVRKRVIKILRDVCENRPDYDKMSDCYMKIIRRMNDEDSVKKLVTETFAALWLHSNQDDNARYKKVLHITDTVLLSRDDSLDSIETLLSTLLKNAESPALLEAQKIVDCLVNNVLKFDVQIDKPTENQHKSSQQKLLACLLTLYLFSRTRPELIVKHAETLLPYLMLSTTYSEQIMLVHVVNILEKVIPLIDHPSDTFTQKLDTDLTNLCKRGIMPIVRASVACLASLVHKQQRSVDSITSLFKHFFKILQNGYQRIRRENPLLPSEKPLVLRSVYLIGLLYRYFEFDQYLPPPNMGNDTHKKEDSLTWRKLTFRILLEMCRHIKDDQVSHKAFLAIGNFCASDSEYLAHSELQQIYHKLMLDDRAQLPPSILALKQQALNNIEIFLKADEDMMAKSYADWQKQKESEDIKQLNDVASGMGSAIIQLYWNPVMNCYFSSDVKVRIAAHRVITLTLQQGLVTPGTSIPTLIAMSTDPEPAIRHKAEALMKEIDAKYSGMIASKAVAGVRQAYRLATTIQKAQFKDLNKMPPVRGYRIERSSILQAAKGGQKKPAAGDCQATLAPLYTLLRSQRQTRRSLLYSILRMFDDSARLELAELLYLADNLALLPYVNQDEPLYVIHQGDQVVTTSGHNLVGEFKAKLLNVSNGTNEPEDEDQVDADHIYIKLPNEIEPLSDVIKQTGACVLLLQLRSYLKHYYNLTETKVQEYSPNEVAKVYEKPASRRASNPPFNPMHTLSELDPNNVQAKMEQSSPQFRWYLSQRFIHFRRMLMSLETFGGDNDDDNDPNDKKKMIQSSAADNDPNSDVDDPDENKKEESSDDAED